MITRQEKAKILERYEHKEEKLFISNILDKAYRFEKENKILYTNFLNLHEVYMAVEILNNLKIEYKVFSPNEFINKKVIFFIPDYIMDVNSIYSDYISILKVTQNVKQKLTHKDYMGSIYSLGIKNEMIGDIFAYDTHAYIYCMKSVKDYFLLNLYKVGNQEVKIEELELFSNEVANISLNLSKKEYIIPSKRIDALLASIYSLSRSEAKEKIVKGDLYINDRNIINPSENVKEGDIVSFRRCGKVKIGSDIRKTRSDNLVIEIFKFT